MEEFLDDLLGQTVSNAAQSWYARVKGMIQLCSLLLHSCPIGPLVAEGCFGGLPVFDDAKPYDPIPEDVKEWLDHLQTQCREISVLAELVQRYESFGPPHVHATQRHPYCASDVGARIIPGDSGIPQVRVLACRCGCGCQNWCKVAGFWLQNLQ
jgi:hypothetical protein